MKTGMLGSENKLERTGAIPAFNSTTVQVFATVLVMVPFVFSKEGSA